MLRAMPEQFFTLLAQTSLRIGALLGLLAHRKTPKQMQGWLRHSQLTTTMNVYIHQVDDGLGSADVWDDILAPPGATPGATEHPETAANRRDAESAEA